VCMIEQIPQGFSRKKTVMLVLLFLISFQSFGQRDSTDYNAGAFILPAGLLAAGVLLNKENTKQSLQSDLFITDTHFDDYVMYVPLVTLAIAQMSGAKSQNHWFDQLKYLGIAQITSTIIVHGMKRSLKIKRPDGGNYAFPSGHASFAFVNAEILHQELKLHHPFIAQTGYVSAAATSVLRLSNQRHWVPDVVFGAGLGIAIGKLIYLWKPFEQFNPFKETKSFSVVIGDNGLGIQYQF